MENTQYFITFNEERISIERLTNNQINEIRREKLKYSSDEIFIFHDVFVDDKLLYFICKSGVEAKSFSINLNDFENNKLDLGLTESYYTNDNENLKIKIDDSALNIYYYNTEVLKEKMCKILKIDKNDIDFSIKSLSTINEKISEFTYSDVYFSKVYPILVIYFGKTLERNTSKHFGLFKNEDEYVLYLGDENIKDSEIEEIIKDYLVEVDFWGENKGDYSEGKLRVLYDYLSR
ncbi:hypothetical protein GCM10011514_07390 [Emticicia aquatilis]|uniref:Uncharacterized protein n=1 Tax=Emticicia aquatilis TaxID=1537369 RepID=A0A917DKF9_9BACT|nr:hypothetical protein [Emticicia aquatilis]GGD45918.1 hypothetical protein GCM10011514_07390 [Emticicia aquatilis]